MTKEVDAKNQVWFEKDGKFVRLGLTRNFLQTLDECWHIIPSNMEHIKEKAPLFTIETNDGIMSLLSPVSGHLSNWDTTAANFPDKLTEEDTILTLSSEVVEKPDDSYENALRRLREAGIAAPAGRAPVNPAPARPRLPGQMFDNHAGQIIHHGPLPDWVQRLQVPAQPARPAPPRVNQVLQQPPIGFFDEQEEL